MWVKPLLLNWKLANRVQYGNDPNWIFLIGEEFGEIRVLDRSMAAARHHGNRGCLHKGAEGCIEASQPSVFESGVNLIVATLFQEFEQ